jgi:hypothetical protein
MSSIFDLLGNHLDQGAISQISETVGADPHATRSVVEGAVPLLVSALAGNASAGGAESILGALSRDHDGSILDDLAGFLGGGGAMDQGAAILGHILGGRQEGAASALSRTSGLSLQKVMQILAMVAPLVMGALGKLNQNRGGFDPGSLTDVLQGERSRVAERSPGLAGVLEQVLDRDGDGSVMDDLASTLGGLLGGRS